ncbi:hypothetical protein HYH39_06740 [Clostridium botulinum]|nr:hypothetical protein [Clostridium botulinum]MBY6851816.1 hypothetical protein [Clostridium botulinum]
MEREDNPPLAKQEQLASELERIKGIRQGSAGGSGSNQYINKVLDGNYFRQAKLASKIGLDARQLRNYKYLTTLIPELQQMIENGSMKATVGYKISKNLMRI